MCMMGVRETLVKGQVVEKSLRNTFIDSWIKVCILCKLQLYAENKFVSALNIAMIECNGLIINF